jgi:hypothetical protein
MAGQLQGVDTAECDIEAALVTFLRGRGYGIHKRKVDDKQESPQKRLLLDIAAFTVVLEWAADAERSAQQRWLFAALVPILVHFFLSSSCWVK